MAMKIVATEDDVLSASSLRGPSSIGDIAADVAVARGVGWEPGIDWTSFVKMADLARMVEALVEEGKLAALDRSQASWVRNSGTRGTGRLVRGSRYYMLGDAWCTLMANERSRKTAERRAALLAQANAIVLEHHAAEVQAEIARLES